MPSRCAILCSPEKVIVRENDGEGWNKIELRSEERKVEAITSQQVVEVGLKGDCSVGNGMGHVLLHVSGGSESPR